VPFENVSAAWLEMSCGSPVCCEREPVRIGNGRWKVEHGILGPTPYRQAVAPDLDRRIVARKPRIAPGRFSFERLVAHRAGNAP